MNFEKIFEMLNELQKSALICLIIQLIFKQKPNYETKESPYCNRCRYFNLTVTILAFCS